MPSSILKPINVTTTYCRTILSDACSVTWNCSSSIYQTSVAPPRRIASFCRETKWRAKSPKHDEIDHQSEKRPPVSFSVRKGKTGTLGGRIGLDATLSSLRGVFAAPFVPPPSSNVPAIRISLGHSLRRRRRTVARLLNGVSYLSSIMQVTRPESE